MEPIFTNVGFDVFIGCNAIRISVQTNKNRQQTKKKKNGKQNNEKINKNLNRFKQAHHLRFVRSNFKAETMSHFKVEMPWHCVHATTQIDQKLIANNNKKKKKKQISILFVL